MATNLSNSLSQVARRDLRADKTVMSPTDIASASGLATRKRKREDRDSVSLASTISNVPSSHSTATTKYSAKVFTEADHDEFTNSRRTKRVNTRSQAKVAREQLTNNKSKHETLKVQRDQQQAQLAELQKNIQATRSQMEAAEQSHSHLYAGAKQAQKRYKKATFQLDSIPTQSQVSISRKATRTSPFHE